MIGSLRGKVAEVSHEAVIVDVGGVGYEVLAPLGILADLSLKSGQDVFLYTYTHVREDALTLFGFLEKQEKAVFLSLLKVNGVGPKMAMNILSAERVERILEMIESGDVKALSKLPKVGKKTAEQLILTLKGKLVLSDDSSGQKKAGGAGGVRVQSELSSALVNLGFRFQDVEKVVSELPADIALEDGLKRGLAALTAL